MKIRLTIAIIVFYLVTSMLLIPLFTNISYGIFYSTPPPKISIAYGSRAKLSNSFYVDRIKSEIQVVFANIINYFRIWSGQDLMTKIIAILLTILGAYIVSIIFNRQYLNLCDRIDDIKSEDYSVKLIKDRYFPEMACKLKELLGIMDKKKQKHEKELDERNRVIDNAVEQFQRAAANAKGKVEVVIEAEVLDKSSQESILLMDAIDSIKQLEDIINSIKRDETK